MSWIAAGGTVGWSGSFIGYPSGTGGVAPVADALLLVDGTDFLLLVDGIDHLLIIT